VNGALLVAGTASDAGKSIVTAGICRWLARQGVRVAPFKAQNMALNSAVTPGGAEIGRAQAMQAAACGIDPEAAMNPILLKPSGERTAQVVVLGQPVETTDARAWQQRKGEFLPVVLDALASLRARFDVVVCEGAGSPAEVNLRQGDLANLGLARAAGLPVLVVGDIDRGGVFAALYGTLALLEPADQDLIAGFLINKFRGDPSILVPGLDRLRTLTGRSVLGVLPWQENLWLDAEDSLALERPLPAAGAPRGRDGLAVAVVRLPWLSNVTDLDALACEPGVSVRLTKDPGEVARADLAVLPGTKETVRALDFVRASGIGDALARRAAAGAPVLGICGGYQLLGRRIVDGVESRRGEVAGLGLLPVTTTFEPSKLLGRPRGTCPMLGGAPALGYEIRHGRVRSDGGAPLLVTEDGDGEGCIGGQADAVLGTSWHGLLENDLLRRRLLAWVAGRTGRRFEPGDVRFAEVRERRLDAVGDLVADHADTDALAALIDGGAPAALPVVTSTLRAREGGMETRTGTGVARR
jgi:adenosylcobyric acid synthase